MQKVCLFVSNSMAKNILTTDNWQLTTDTSSANKKRHLFQMPVMQENPKRVIPTPSQQSATVAN